MGLIEADWVKRALIKINRLHDTLYNLDLVTITKTDLIKWRGPGYRSPLHFGQEGHDLLKGFVQSGAPFMASRLGAVELACLRYFLEKRGSGKKPYSARVRTTMSNQAGFFPVDDQSLDRFAQTYLEELAQVDVMGVWFNQFENVVCNDYCTGATLVDLDCLEPFRFSSPWSALLAGKRVLVVHPFAQSIQSQYRDKRQLLFACPDVLPEFELSTLKTVQSIGSARVGYDSWFDAYRHMCDQMSAEDFDVCLIGAGAYGLPLASFAKQLGKQAIHLGGVTQILFGIRGKRWEVEYADSTAKLFNEHWVRPLASETPSNKDTIEKGCYW
jgi:hypothetical protein